MTKARSELIDISATPYYHVMSRCVRRSYLCGEDPLTGQDYSHRKSWLINRMKDLADVFAIKICAYAVMSNHYHLVLFVDEKQAQTWSDSDVRIRWSQIFPNDAQKLEREEAAGQLKPIVQAKIDLWRERLQSISWYMRCLNEPIARMSNQEDEASGRFWEGRFRSQSLLDEGALLTAMAYVDLNPVRAQTANTPEESEYTSIYERIQCIAKQLNEVPRGGAISVDHTETKSTDLNHLEQPQRLMPFLNKTESPTNNTSPSINFKISDYLQLVDETSRVLRDDKKGSVPPQLAPLLARIQLTASGWLSMVKGLETHFSYAVGHEDRLEFIQRDDRQRKIKGIYLAKKCYVLNAA